MKQIQGIFILLAIVSCSNPDHFAGKWKGISTNAADTLLITKNGNTQYSVQLPGSPAQEATLKDDTLEFGKPEFRVDISYNSSTGHLLMLSPASPQALEFIRL